MEGLSPTLRCILEVRFALENGESVRAGLSRAMNQVDHAFTRDLQRWLFAWDQGHPIDLPALNSYQRNFVSLLAHSLKGHPIRSYLLELQAEVEQACFDQIDEFIRLLPLKMSLPVLCLQFPAFLILLLGPLLGELLKGLQ